MYIIDGMKHFTEELSAEDIRVEISKKKNHGRC